MWAVEDVIIYDCAFTSDGAMLVTAGSRNRIDVWDPVSGDAIKTYESASYDTYSLAIYPLNAPIVVSGGNAEPPQVWNLDEGTELAAPAGHAFTVRAVAFSPDGETFATGDNGGTVRLWTVASAQQSEPLSAFESPDSQVISVAYNPAGTLIAAGYIDGMLRIWDISGGPVIFETAAHSNWIGSISWSPDGTRLFTASLDGSLRVWAVGSGQ
jgi:WD40 repeat protein